MKLTRRASAHLAGRFVLEQDEDLELCSMQDFRANLNERSLVDFDAAVNNVRSYQGTDRCGALVVVAFQTNGEASFQYLLQIHSFKRDEIWPRSDRWKSAIREVLERGRNEARLV